MDFMTITGQMLSLFFIMAIGYIMYKAKVIDDEAKERYTKLVLNISVPAQIVNSFVSNQGAVSNGAMMRVFCVTAICYVIFAILGVLFIALMRMSRQERGTYLFMAIFGNVGFMGFPVVSTIFGDQMMIYAVIFNVMFNFVVFSLGIQLISSAGGGAKFNPRLLVNMPLLSSLVSVLLFLLKIPLPSVVTTSFSYLSNLTTPVAMLILGATIAAMPLRELFDDWRIYVFTGFRLVLIPAVILAVLHVCHITTPEIAGVLVILSAMPVATNATMLAIEYGGDVRLASKGIFFTTLLSVITIPLVALFC